MSLQLVNITKRYAETAVVDRVSFDVPAGSLTAVIGPSGSGKSSLLRAVAGLTTLDEGAVVLEGRDVTAARPQDRNIGFCFQNYAVFPHMSVAKNVGYGLKVRGKSRHEIAAKVDELLHLVRLADKAQRFPNQLSGGERQRMALARALAIEPGILLLDEPFGALDAVVRAELREWLKELHRQVPITTVLVTHDQHEAMDLADQVVVMNAGRVEQVGAPLAVYDRPANEFVHGFLGPTTTLAGRLVRPHDVEVVPLGEAEVKGIVRDVAHTGWDVRLSVALSDATVTTVWRPRHEHEASPLGVGDEVGLRRRPHSDEAN